ncbi:hypothetical protein V6N13_051129 [Hibiscus sabdariffa]|uniref:Glabrous enhancer-binding protein-like DBD domain-containing protein n=1 Tax=Hibiscus sabdariffa TaxID=183260 RepID=A0ABR2T2P8_9ROSI
MGPKRSDLIENPPPASSSDDDGEEEDEEEEVTSYGEEEENEMSSSGEEEDGDDDDDDDDDDGSSQEEDEEPKTQKSLLPRKPETATASDESDQEPPIVKPIATKPMEESSNVKRIISNPLASTVKACPAKRPSEPEQEAEEAKRPKKKGGEEETATAAVAEEVKRTGEDTKKLLFQRLFSEDDEIAVLKGMLEYYDKKGVDPCADMNAFYEFVRKMIQADVTKAQLMDKIRRLRKKFENNAGKAKMGEHRIFSKPHEQKAFQLSRKIWGNEGIYGKVEPSSARSNAKPKGNDKDVERGERMNVDNEKRCKNLYSLMDKRLGVAGLEEEVLKNGLDMIDEEHRAVLVGKWKKLRIAELELFLERCDLIKEHAKLMLESYKSENK